MISVEMWEICVDQMPWSFIFLPVAADEGIRCALQETLLQCSGLTELDSQLLRGI